MDLTSVQRKLIFAAVVVVLAALGAFLIIPATFGRHSDAGHGRAVGLTTPLSGTSPSPVPSSPAPSARFGLSATPATGAGADIYRWLPFTQAGLTAAADLVRRFAAAYASYSYTQTAAGYARQLNGLVTAQLAAVIARGFATPGVAQLRTQQKQIATGTGQITAVRAFGPNNITFVVAITQKVTGTSGAQRTITDYAVTVTGAASNWQVEDLELASAGNT